jgi:hypothetical protein
MAYSTLPDLQIALKCMLADAIGDSDLENQ